MRITAPCFFTGMGAEKGRDGFCPPCTGASNAWCVGDSEVIGHHLKLRHLGTLHRVNFRQ